MTSSITVKRGCLAAIAMAVSLQAVSAPRFSPEKQPLGSIAPLVLSNPDLSGNTTKGYRPWFENGSWQGDLVEYTVTDRGNLSTSVDFSQSSPTNTGANWSALVNFAATDPATYWHTDREIITLNSSTKLQAAFRFTDAGIGDKNMELLDPTAWETDEASKILNFVRGERSNEYPNPDGAQLRHRTSILGAIIHSRPVYVGAPNDTRTEVDYAEFAKDNSSREPRVYVGANDGMLHVFDAADGREVYAYVPSMLMAKLGLLTARPYSPTYYVDGEMSVRDAQINGEWHTVLAGSLGAGGKGFFILDITNPDLDGGEASTLEPDQKVLFEYSGSDDNDLGDSFSRPVIAKLNDGDWYVVVGNGYNSVNGEAVLYLVNLDTLNVTKIPTSSGGTAGNPNGLSSPSLLDTDRNGTADYAYAGDIDGNLWKFDLSKASGWKVAYDRPLHPTAGNQAIVHAPQITLHPRYGYMVYFATGRLFTPEDLEDTSVQSLYGIWDSGKTPPLNAASQILLEQTWDGPKTYNYLDAGNMIASQTIAIYNPDGGSPDWTTDPTDHGWKVDFPAGGYRVLQPVQVRANRVMATVYRPIDGQQGENWLVQALLNDGGPNPPNAPVYDLNVDRILNDADLYDNGTGVGAEVWHVPMMWRQAAGIMSQATIGNIARGTDTLFINYLQPPVVNTSEPCTENCANGFLWGHMDVVTYRGLAPPTAAPLGGYSTDYTHAYEEATGRLYVDFFDINVPYNEGEPGPERRDVDKQVEIPPTADPEHSSNIPGTEKFIVLVANADFSSGGTLQIGTKTWNVLEYQILIHNALKNWDPGVLDSVPVDADGDPLVFTWSDIQAAGGTIRISFNERSLIDGGLHPTQPNCITENATGGRDRNTYNTTTKVGRWRNGALTIQLVRKSYFTDNPVNPALAMVDIQLPGNSLAPEVTTPDGITRYTTIDYDDDQYETVGGLLARNKAEHLWEATLNWHFGDLSQFTNLGRPCWGDPNWEAAVALELENDPIAATFALLGEDITVESLASEIAALEGCKNEGVAQGGCQEKYERLAYILTLVPQFTEREDENGNNDGPGDDTPLVLDGGSTGAGLEGDGGDGSITEGGSYEPGRMSWTDIVK